MIEALEVAVRDHDWHRVGVALAALKLHVHYAEGERTTKKEPKAAVEGDEA